MAFFSPSLVSRELYDPLDLLSPTLSLYNNLLSQPVHHHLVIRPRRQASSDASKPADIRSDSNKFQVMLNVKHFKPEELTVKTVDNFVVIHGKHEETADEHGFVSREFTRRYAIPEDVEPEKIQSSLSQDGILTIVAPRKMLEPPPKNERVVPITMQQPAAAEQQQRLQEQAQQQQEAQQQQQQSQDKMEE